MNRINAILVCFFEGSPVIACDETLWQAAFKASGILHNGAQLSELTVALSSLPPHRWTIAVTIDGQEAPHSLRSGQLVKIDEFVQDVQQGWLAGQSAELSLTMERSLSETSWHLIEPQIVFKWLWDMPLPETLSEFTKLITNPQGITICHPTFSSNLGSKGFSFGPSQSALSTDNTVPIREAKSLLRREQVMSDWGKSVLFPEDFEWIGDASQPLLRSLFARLANFLAVVSIADATLAGDRGALESFHIRVKGHRLREQDLNWSEIPEKQDMALMQVYKWCYSAGGAGPLPDKLGLARNFISLYWIDGIFGLSLQVVAAVRGGYELYLKRNLKEYVELRAKVTSTILEIDGKVSKAVETAAGNLEKNFYGLTTFVTSVLLIKAMTAKEFTGAFTPQVATLGYIMIGISVLHAVYAGISTWGEMTRAEQLYEDLRRQYSQFFTPADWNILFGSEGNSPMKKTKDYLKGKLQSLMLVWGATLLGAAITIFVLTKT